MKVMLLAGGNVGHTRRWANGLANAGLGVVCVSQHEFLPEDWESSVERIRLPYSGPLGYWWNSGRLVHLFGHHGCDLLNAHYATGYGAMATLSGIRPRIVSVWGSDVYEFPWKSRLHRELVRRVLRSADRVASTSVAMASEVERVAGVLDHPIQVTPFGVDLAQFSPRPAEAKPGGKIVIGTVKSLAHCYGIDVLIDAFALLRRRQGGERLRLRIVGDGPERAALRARAARLEDSVEFVGAVTHEQVPSELRQMDIFVAASRIESFGVAVIEASATGLPVVVSDAGGLPEVVERDVTGLIVPRESPAALAAALAVLVDDADLRARLGDEGRKMVKRKFEWAACVAVMMEMYQAQHDRWRAEAA